MDVPCSVYNRIQQHQKYVSAAQQTRSCQVDLRDVFASSFHFPCLLLSSFEAFQCISAPVAPGSAQCRLICFRGKRQFWCYLCNITKSTGVFTNTSLSNESFFSHCAADSVDEAQKWLVGLEMLREETRASPTPVLIERQPCTLQCLHHLRH